MNPEPIAPATGQLPTYQPSTAPPRRRRTGLVVGLVLAVIVLVVGTAAGTYLLTRPSGSGATSSTAQTFTAEGTLTVTGGCGVIGGYGDINNGTQVVLTDGAGKTVAVGQLQSTHSSTLCSFTWTLAGIPVGEKFYGIAVARRGVLQVTESDLRAGVNINIGS